MLLFDSEESLNSKGLDCLNLYLTNLAGYDKLSWNDRLNKSTDVYSYFLDAYMYYSDINSKEKYKEKMEKFLSKVS